MILILAFAGWLNIFLNHLELCHTLLVYGKIKKKTFLWKTYPWHDFQVEDLRDRVKDKDSTIDRKSKKSHSLQSEKRKIETEVAELKEQIEIKDRRISNLQTQVRLFILHR